MDKKYEVGIAYAIVGKGGYINFYVETRHGVKYSVSNHGAEALAERFVLDNCQCVDQLDYGCGGCTHDQCIIHAKH